MSAGDLRRPGRIAPQEAEPLTMTTTTTNDWVATLQRAEQLFDQGEWDEAWRLSEEVLRVQPFCAGAIQVQGLVLSRRNRPFEAIPRLHQAIALRPDLVPSHNDLGLSYSQIGEHEKAIEHFNIALTLNYQHPFAHFNRALLWLKLGKFREGWVEYEWRWATQQLKRPEIPRPRWDGSPLNGRTILIHTEQGLGDVLQFIRFLPILKRQGGKVVLACQTALIPFLRQLDCVDEWFPIDQEAPVNFDVYLPLLSLPAVLGIDDEDAIACRVPYVFAETERVEHWRRIIDALPGFRIGISWQGSKTHRGDSLRSIPLKEFAPVAAVPGVSLVSLQKGFGEEQIEPAREIVPLTVFPDRDADGTFLDTSAIMQHLDLVLACDTSVVHLAGALGRPVWTLIAIANDWRWMTQREDSVWYPTMRLLRQQRFGDWTSVIQNVVQSIRREIRNRS